MMNRVLFCLSLASFSAAAASPAASSRRLALVVSANRGEPGRQELKYAAQDAQSIADALIELGNFAKSDVTTLSEPTAEQILQALVELKQRVGASAPESLLLFYYSGHADQNSLLLGKSRLPFHALREQLDGMNVTLRIGIIDACRGGGWTRAKGLTKEAPFEVEVPMNLQSEGSVLISSSSGAEDAHESEVLRGSFFTHHFVAGLRGAADDTHDGEVTLAEAFRYAQELTVRDTALQADAPQHPSFDMNMRGRSELPLTRIHEAKSLVVVTQNTGPLQVVHLQSGQVLVEVPSGARTVQLAIPPGKYLVRRRDAQGTVAKEITVEPQSSVPLNEAHLQLIGDSQLEVKGATPSSASSSTLPSRDFQIRFALGMQNRSGGSASFGFDLSESIVGLFGFAYGITNRLQLVAPLGFAYRFGERGGIEWVPAVGLTHFSFGYSNLESLVVFGSPAVQMAARIWLGQNRALNFELGTSSSFQFSSLRRIAPNSWNARASVGITLNPFQRTTFSLGVSWNQNYLVNGQIPAKFNSIAADGTFGIGSVQSVGLLPLPLASVQVTRLVSLDAYAALFYKPAQEQLTANLMVGASFTF